LEKPQLQTGHIGEEMRTKIVRVHQTHKHAERFLVGHLSISGYLRQERTLRRRAATIKAKP
jgi:hypothetical protein